MRRRSSRRLTALAFVGLLLLLVVVTPPRVTSYTNDQVEVLDNVTSCGDANGCHGPASPTVQLILEGPEELEVNQEGWYNATLLGGPFQAYGFYIVVTNANGVSKDINGDLLVRVTSDQARNVTHDRALRTNHISFNVTAPKYAGEFKIHVAYNSANGDGLNSTADNWTSRTFDLQVVYPLEKVGWNTFRLGLLAFLFSVTSMLYFKRIRSKLKVMGVTWLPDKHG